MQPACEHRAPFLDSLKSAAGFAIASTTVVGLLVALFGAEHDKMHWLPYAAALLGGLLGAVFGVPGAKK